MTDLFQFNAYKLFLKATIADNREKRGFQSRLAQAAGCQASYLSQVLNGKAELLPDQAAGIANFLELNDLESDYFLSLVLLGRSTSKPLRDLLGTKIAQIRRSTTTLERRVGNSTPIAVSFEKTYYSSWYWAALHVATSIPRLQETKALADWLSLPLKKVRRCLEEMRSYGLVKKASDRWIYAGGAAHLPPTSVMTELNHTHWRHQAILNVQREDDSSVHYTSVFSMSEADAEKMRELLIQSIAKTRKISDPSESESVFSFNLDFFRV